jgi:hypothetical protein
MSKSVFASTQWSIKQTKLAICIPCRDTLHSAHALSLSNLVKFNTLNNIDSYVFMDLSTVLLNQRENLASSALELGSEYVLWLDSDIVFPETTAIRLMAHDESFVAANYVTRSKPTKSVAYRQLHNWNSSLSFDNANTLEDVEGIGLGCVLMKTEIFTKLPQPWFEFSWNSKSKDHLGEDFNLCKKITNLGYKLKVDTMLSRELRHLGTYAFSHKDLD